MPHNLNRKQKTQKIFLFMYERKRFDAFDKEKLQHPKAEIYSVTVLHIIFKPAEVVIIQYKNMAFLFSFFFFFKKIFTELLYKGTTSLYFLVIPKYLLCFIFSVIFLLSALFKYLVKSGNKHRVKCKLSNIHSPFSTNRVSWHPL